jgi:uncharacterized protein (TIGR02594 family)
MADFSTIIPWIVLLIVFVVMAAIIWRGQTLSADQAKVMLQLLGQRGPVPVAGPVHFDLTPLPPAAPRPVALPTAVPALPKHLEPPALAKPAGVPPWYQWSLHEIGFHETGNNQGIERYIGLAHCGALGDPWCAIFFNAAMESCGIPGTRSASSQSPRHHPDFVQLDGPAVGAIAVCWRGQKPVDLASVTTGHVGFYRGEDATHVWVLGGNENDMVQIEALPKSSATFGLIGYWWPKSVPLPVTGPVLMPTGSPVHVQTPSAETAIPVSAPSAPGAEFRALVPGGFFSSSPFDKSIPASIRTNNPGALNVAEWIKHAPGYVGDKVTSMSGASPNSTVIFSAPEYGVAAWLTLLQKYRAAGAITVSAIINRYGGGQDYSGYVGQVAAWSGLGEQTVIDLEGNGALLAFAKAMFRYEAGRPSPLSDAQILHGFNLALGSPASPLAEPPTPKVT